MLHGVEKFLRQTAVCNDHEPYHSHLLNGEPFSPKRPPGGAKAA